MVEEVLLEDNIALLAFPVAVAGKINFNSVLETVLTQIFVELFQV